MTLFLAAIATGPVLAAEEHLPEKAKVVAAKFEVYKEKATPSEVAAKRKQVVDYLGSLLKQEAADANLDGALALRDLIDSINGNKPRSQVVKKAEPSPAPASAKTEGLKQTSFSITQQRRIEFPFFVAKDRLTKTIRCEFTGASDDSGDLGLHYELIDPSGRVAKAGFLQSGDTDLVTHKVSKSGEWKIVVIDEDTALDSEFPGNNGTVRVTVMHGEAALASNRRAR